MMKPVKSWVLGLVFLAAPAAASADPISLTTTISTRGTFFCVGWATCSIGEGGSSIGIPSDTGNATVTFTGVNTTVDVTNESQRITLGEFSVTANEGFHFPVNSANPEQSIFGFSFQLTDPDDGSWEGGLNWRFGPGGGTTLAQRGNWGFAVPANTDLPYDLIAFTTNSPVLVVNGTTALTADVGLVPEPSSMLLLGTGLVGAVLRKRRLRQQADSHARPA